jgi:hypothetical protein
MRARVYVCTYALTYARMHADICKYLCVYAHTFVGLSVTLQADNQDGSMDIRKTAAQIQLLTH